MEKIHVEGHAAMLPVTSQLSQLLLGALTVAAATVSSDWDTVLPVMGDVQRSGVKLGTIAMVRAVATEEELKVITDDMVKKGSENTPEGKAAAETFDRCLKRAMAAQHQIVEELAQAEKLGLTEKMDAVVDALRKGAGGTMRVVGGGPVGGPQADPSKLN